MAPAGKKFMNGVYSKTDWDLNGRAHYERSLAKEDKVSSSFYWVCQLSIKHTRGGQSIRGPVTIDRKRHA